MSKRTKLSVKERKARIRHAICRAWKRYRVNLDRFSFKKLVTQIQTGEAVSLFSLSLINTLHLVTVEDQIMVALYNKKLNSITTFLPKSACFEYVKRGRISRRQGITLTEAYNELESKLT